MHLIIIRCVLVYLFKTWTFRALCFFVSQPANWQTLNSDFWEQCKHWIILKAFKDFKCVSLEIKPGNISLICKYLVLEWKSCLIPSSHATSTVCVVIKWSYKSIREPLQPTTMIFLCSGKGCGNYMTSMRIGI